MSSGDRDSPRDFDTLSDAGNNKPTALWSDGTNMWVADVEDLKVYAYEMLTGPPLKTFELSGIDFDFSGGSTDFRVWVPNTTTVTTVTTETSTTSATVVVSPDDSDDDTDGHQVALSTGDNTITVTVTKGTETSTYTVIVTQVDSATLSADADLSALTLSGVTIGAFASSTKDYTANVANSVSSTTLAATPSDEYAAVRITPADSDADTDGHQIDLAEGRNPITISVTSTNGQVTNEYRVAVNRSSDDDFGWVPTKDIDLGGIKSNFSPMGLWSDDTTMWAAKRGGRIFAFDPSTVTRVSSSDIRAPARGQHDPGAMWSDGDTLWVTDWSNSRRVFAYDLDTGNRDTGSEINLPNTTPNRQPSAIWSDGDTLWLADFWVYDIFAYDLDTGNRISSSDIDTTEDAGNISPTGMWSDGDTLWISDQGKKKIFAYDLDTGERQPSNDFDTLIAAGNERPMDIWSDGTTMWVADRDDDKLYAYNMP